MHHVTALLFSHLSGKRIATWFLAFDLTDAVMVICTSPPVKNAETCSDALPCSSSVGISALLFCFEEPNTNTVPF